MGIWNFHTHLILFLSKLFLFWIHLSSSSTILIKDKVMSYYHLFKL